MVSSTVVRIDRLLEFLKADPENPSLLADAAKAALEDGRFGLTSALVARYAAKATPPPMLVNLAGLAAMGEARFADAASCFQTAYAASAGDPDLAYNLAWARAAQADWAGANDVLDEDAAAATPAAARLKVQVLHHLGRLADALEWGRRLAERHPTDHLLMGALSAVAVDAEDIVLAEAFARRGESAPESQATLGMLLLEQNRSADAAAYFDAALISQPNTGRALLGQGLERLMSGDAATAVGPLDQAAVIFGDHLGSWLAAGWAHLISGDLTVARARFETALALDAAFAETQGAMAVVAALEGRTDAARRHAQVALRLDRQCLSALLARSLLLEAVGQHQAADQIRKTAMDIPLGPSGQTIAQALLTFGARRK